MNLEEFKIDLESKLAALSDDELRRELERVGCDFTAPEVLDSIRPELPIENAKGS